MVNIVEMGSPNPILKALALSATNMGPGEVTLNSAMIAFRGHFFGFKSFGLLSTLVNFPVLKDHNREHVGAGFPAKLVVGEQYSAYLVPAHHALAKGDYQRIGFADSFGRFHWALRRDILKALPSIREACENAGVDWRAPI